MENCREAQLWKIYEKVLKKFAIQTPKDTILFSFFSNRPSPSSFWFIFVFFKHTLQFLQQIYVKNVHPVYRAGIKTHNFQHMSLHP